MFLLLPLNMQLPAGRSKVSTLHWSTILQKQFIIIIIINRLLIRNEQTSDVYRKKMRSPEICMIRDLRDTCMVTLKNSDKNAFFFIKNSNFKY